MMFGISNFITLEMQGYYYTFSSLIALQIIFELGINNVVLQFVSHEMVGMKLDGTKILGSVNNIARFSSLLNFVKKWYFTISIAFLLTMVPFGIAFFERAQDGLSRNVILPWVFLVTVTSINLYFGSYLTILEGAGRIEKVALTRLFQAFIAPIACVYILWVGGGLYALAAYALGTTLSLLLFIIKDVSVLSRTLNLNASYSIVPIEWKSEIFPLQWRIAISWICGYFIFQVFNPYIFMCLGADEAGRMGLTLQIINTLNGFGLAWLSTSVPFFGKMIADGDFAILNLHFDRLLVRTMIFMVGLVVAAGIIYFVLYKFSLKELDRVLPATQFTLMLLVVIINHYLFCVAAYLRAFKKEPFMLVSVVVAVTTLIMLIYLVPIYGTLGAVLSYVFSSVLGFLLGRYIYINNRVEWTKS